MTLHPFKTVTNARKGRSYSIVHIRDARDHATISDTSLDILN